MEIVATKRLKDGLNFVIEYMEDGQLHCLFISAEKVVKYYKAVEQLRALDGAVCTCKIMSSVIGDNHAEDCALHYPPRQ